VYDSQKIGNIKTFADAAIYLLNTLQLKARKELFIKMEQLVYHECVLTNPSAPKNKSVL